ncbi:MAG: ribonuclease III [Chloroflexaceae bacterium]|nr:ribonuclease III [Chloroflexaceae bacterium]
MKNQFSAITGIAFHNERLLHAALMHRSFKQAHPERAEGVPSNERLEFLGDAVLTFLTTAWIYGQFPDFSAGAMNSLRVSLVRTTTLARFARELRLGECIRLSRAEESREARNRDALLADVFEAVLGAIYLDQGIDAARSFVLPLLEAEARRVFAGQAEADYRTRLQHQLQSRYGVVPVYRTVEESGPPHRRLFTVEVLRGEQSLGMGTGASKQAAAQEAARLALDQAEWE